MTEQTSYESYWEEIEKGNTGSRRQEVYNALASLGTATDREIAAAIGVGDPNYVRPRRFELVETGEIKCVGTKKCEITGKKAKAWRIT